MANLKMMDPVTLGMCSQSNLDEEITKAVKRQINKRQREEKAAILLKKNMDSDPSPDKELS